MASLVVIKTGLIECRTFAYGSINLKEEQPVLAVCFVFLIKSLLSLGLSQNKQAVLHNLPG